MYLPFTIFKDSIPPIDSSRIENLKKSDPVLFTLFSNEDINVFYTVHSFL